MNLRSQVARFTVTTTMMLKLPEKMMRNPLMILLVWTISLGSIHLRNTL
jgi:hypothetical protein